METVVIKMTERGRPYTVKFDPSKPKPCSDIDEKGEFGCHKMIFIASYPKGAGHIGYVPIIKDSSGLFQEEQWINHWMDCEFEERFHALQKKRNEDKNRRANIR